MNSPKSPRKKPKQNRSRDTVEAIIEATTRIIEHEGLARLTTNHVAAVAGVSVGSLYQYFPNKEALVAEVRARFGARFQAALLALLERLPGLGLREAVRAWVTTLVELHADSPGVHNAVGSGTPPEGHGVLAIAVRGYLSAHASEIRRPDLELSGRVLMDASEALIHNTALREPALLEDPRWVEEVCDLLERYLVLDDVG